jgi:pimeloyl-ACP methyl ester carboxylesterase
MTPWTSGLCYADGLDIHYLRTGGPKAPVVLLHGLTGSGACWTPLARALEADHDVVMPDARGHGASGTPDGGYRYDDLARDVVGLIRGLGLDAPVLVGHSMGGMTAAVVAGRQGGLVGLVRGVVLADPTFLEPERQREVHASDVVAQHRRTLGLEKGVVVAEARARHPGRSAEIVELVVEARLRTRPVAWDVLTPPNPDYRELVRAIDVPTLLVIGDRGNVVSLETAAELRGLNPRLRVEQIRDAGHGLPYDQPERFAALLTDFLRASG